MNRERTRRSVLAALLASGTIGIGGTSVGNYLDRFAPGSGSVWDTVDAELPDQVESPYGPATLSYDDDGVPHISADSEKALYFAAGYAQGADRLFQMDLIRRQMSGTLSAVVGKRTVASDRFHVGMDFSGAAQASWEQMHDTEAGRLTKAFSEGVNRHLNRPLPPEFDMLGYEPDP